MKTEPYRISRSLSWRKSVVFAKALLIGGTRWEALLLKLRKDPAVTPRLWDQALACVCACKGLNYDIQLPVAQKALAALSGLDHPHRPTPAPGR